MKENENKKSVVRVTEGNSTATADVLQDGTQNNKEKLKKSLIFGLMAIVFVGCMYLIFKPSEDKKTIENVGLNDAVPEATGTGMPADKGKAYEQEMLERKEQEKRNAYRGDKYYLSTSINTTFSKPLQILYKFDFHSKIEQIMEVVTIQKSALDGIKNELKELLGLIGMLLGKYNSDFQNVEVAR